HAARGPLVVALEIPRSQQAALDGFLIAADPLAARDRLLVNAFCHRDDDQHDGRRSHDMLDLLLHLHGLRATGRDVALLAYDVESGPAPVARDARDAAMADRLRAAHDALPDGTLLVLAGNAHAARRRPDY